ncbi:hypothetical protein E4633_12565 [Geomonas terrae]|uniref:Uncharacterized protein n=1 Tax=Geomonas terrae TaxID=2562681 RepID=A0A4S1CCN9_9BACT|nr:hypothetical protein [Geomonas terrae]TGU71174.1 hypothetical protein E4633_12565 [Geomonas terrae]
MAKASAVATIADVKRELANLDAAVAKDPSLEGLMGKKLWVVVDNLTIKDGVTKDLKQAYTNGEKWHAVNAKKKLYGCTDDNEQEKIKEYILGTDAYARHYGNPDTRAKVEKWLADMFPEHGDNAGGPTQG